MSGGEEAVDQGISDSEFGQIQSVTDVTTQDDTKFLFSNFKAFAFNPLVVHDSISAVHPTIHRP